MFPTIIGFTAGIFIIFFFRLFKGVNEATLYGLLLSGIGFIYVGFTWSSFGALAVNLLQATVFIFLAYLGIKKNNRFLIAGYFLHGVWDLCYSLFVSSALIPPHYDWFCLTVDFTIGAYLFGRSVSKLRSKTSLTIQQAQN